MTSVDVELGLTALAAMLSPTTLTFTVLALVLGERPGRTGIWFFVGAFGVTLIIGVAAAFVLGDVAAPASGSQTPPTWVSVVDVFAALAIVALVVRALRRPRNPERARDMVRKASGLASAPAIAIVAAGATLANPGGFIPLALKEISQLNPGAREYIVLWAAFALVSLLPLLAALLSLAVAREATLTVLRRMRVWLELHARTLAAVILLLLAAALLRNGIVGLSA